MKVLITGFDPFGPFQRNPSEEVVTRASNNASFAELAEIYGVVLPTHYTDAPKIAIDALCNINPDLIVMLGLSSRATTMNLERLALNFSSSSATDNAGQIKRGEIIEPAGPIHHNTKIDLKLISDRFARENIPCNISNYAGGFVCNALYYSVLHHLSGERDTRALFIHLPWSYSTADESSEAEIPLNTHEDYVQKALRCLITADA